MRRFLILVKTTITPLSFRGAPFGASPESIHDREYGFRACAFGASRK